MPQKRKNLTIHFKNRKTIREKLIKEFLKEKPGTGKGELTSVYLYYVETLTDGRRIYLKRPARLNKGMDFEVNVEQTNFGTIRRTAMPSHKSILKDLKSKKKKNPRNYKKVEALIEKIYSCEDVSDAQMRAIKFDSGHPIELILKSIKWLFIEQDITYWNWSGRNMFYSGIIEL